MFKVVMTKDKRMQKKVIHHLNIHDHINVFYDMRLVFFFFNGTDMFL